MDLGGKWRAIVWEEGLGRDPSDAGLDDSAWPELAVPGHWMSDPAFAGTDGPVMYRTRFDAAAAEPGRRCFLTFEGIFYQGDVWLDGEYLGDTEGYFAPQSFEVTSALARQTEHLLGVEVACSRPTDVRSKRNLTGVFQHWDCIDRAWNPGGIWAPVRLHETGPVRLRSLKVLCSDANPDSAALDLEADLDSEETLDATLDTLVRREGGDGSAASHTQDQALAAGGNVVRWRVNVERPDLWWPHALGAQPLYQVQVSVALGGATSDRREVTTGLRQVRVRNFTATVNGERVFLKGANCGPTRRALAEATEADLAGDVTLARQAGLDLLRVHA
ncbi:MAG: glycosyl hydrolase 2 galactose-binding domain-containing protein, partial [Acidimicrobiales bacterium]